MHTPEASDQLCAGVLEFEEKNDIGLQNAKLIAPQYLISHLKAIGVYRLMGHLEVEKVLNEQEFQMTGLVDDATAVNIGKLIGLQAIIFGSVMKVGDVITISGRVINAETSEVIAAGSVVFSSVKELDANMEKLAYMLSGFRESEYQNRTMEKLISRQGEVPSRGV